MRLIRLVSGSLLLATLCGASGEGRKDGKTPIVLKAGPHLLVDDYLVESSEGVKREVVRLQRFLEKPVVTSGPEHRNWQPWFTVLRDPALPTAKQFRIWYNADADPNDDDDRHQTKFGYLESTDGIHWPGAYQAQEQTDSMLFGACVVDDGPKHATPAERYKLMYYRSPKKSDIERDLSPGVAVAFSPDGFRWALHNEGKTVLPLPSPGADSWHAMYDAMRQRYLLIGKNNQLHEWTNAEGEKLNKRIRLFGTSFSRDFKTWGEFSEPLFRPDEKDSGITEWYGITGFQTRGDLIIGFLQLLRDDLSPEGAPAEAIASNRGKAGSGMGHTVLCWTRDGQTWHRDRESDALLSPDTRVGTWDHAIAWVGSTLAVDDEVYLYYGGYRWGHKYRRSLDRQIGIVKTERDRFVARKAGAGGGSFVTPLVKLDGEKLKLNANATAGEIRVEVWDATGKPVPGLTAADCRPMRGDAIAAVVEWGGKSLAEVRNQPVRLRFVLKDAAVFAFEVGSR